MVGEKLLLVAESVLASYKHFQNPETCRDRSGGQGRPRPLRGAVRTALAPPGPGSPHLDPDL